MHAERELRRRGWALASAPAEADVLLVCGVPGPALNAVCNRTWAQFPGPRARAAAVTPGSIAAALDDAASSLLDSEAQRRDARERLPYASTHGDDGTSADGDDGTDDSPMDHGSHDGASHHDGDMDHGDMDHGDMDMPMPGGIGLAEGGPDRDGLDLDVLNVPLGPVLLHWPAGLVLRCALQGDVITEASVEVLEAGETPPSGSSTMTGDSGTNQAREFCVGRCDAAGRLLGLAGAENLSARAFAIRDKLLEGSALDEVAEQVRRLSRSTNRSWMLQWSLKEPAGVWTTLMRWLEEALSAAEGNGAAAATSQAASAAARQMTLESLPEQVRGLDLAAARLVVAAADLCLVSMPSGGGAR